MESHSQTPDMPSNEFRVEINVSAAQNKLLVTLQHLLDFLAIGISGAAKVSDEDYAAFGSFFTFVPAQGNRLTREAASREAAAWHLRNAFRDAIEATGLYLDACRDIAAVCEEADNGVITISRYNEIIGSETRSFHRRGFPEKLQRLADDFGLTCDLTEHLLSINRVRNCLVHRLGIPSERDVDSNGRLVLRWRAFEFFGESPDGTDQLPIERAFIEVPAGWSVKMRASDRERSFELGQRVTLNYDEITHTFVTVMQFAMQMTEQLHSRVSQFGAQAGPPEDEA